MSINSETTRPNAVGALIQGTVASIAVNGFVQPLGTIKSRVMSGIPFQLRQRNTYRGLYAGYRAICGVDMLTFTINNFVNSLQSEENSRHLFGMGSGLISTTLNNSVASLREHEWSKLWFAIASGLISTPFVAFGEHFVTNRQATGSGYRAIFENFNRYNFRQGLYTTAVREMMFTTAVFWGPGAIRKAIGEYYPEEQWAKSDSLPMLLAPGIITGGVAGVITNPCDLIKTRVQVSATPLSIRSAVLQSGWRGLFVGVGWRVPSVALAAMAYDVVNKVIPQYLPNATSREQ